jgi:RNA polymerase sigma-70 factor (ECF subfamily)
VPDRDLLTDEFEDHRAHLRAVAYRMLGSLTEADDAVQEAWLRLHRSGTEAVANLEAWLTTVVARVCLDMLRSRKARREAYLGSWLPEPLVSANDELNPEHEAVLADSVGLALLVVLETLTPAERLSFVLHDMFSVPFDEIAPIVGRTPAAARQLASRARRRVQNAAPGPEIDIPRQRELVDAFLSAARLGDFDALLAVLDPEVVFRVDGGGVVPPAREPILGAAAVAQDAMMFARPMAQFARPALVNGAPGLVIAPEGTPVAVLSFTIHPDRIVAIDAIADPAKLDAVHLAELS